MPPEQKKPEALNLPESEIDIFVRSLQAKGFPTTEENMRNFATIVQRQEGYPVGLLGRLSYLATWIPQQTFYEDLDQMKKLLRGKMAEGSTYYIVQMGDRRSGELDSGLWMYDLLRQGVDSIPSARDEYSRNDLLDAKYLSPRRSQQELFPSGSQALLIDDWSITAHYMGDLIQHLPKWVKASVVLLYGTDMALEKLLQLPQVGEVIVVGGRVPASREILTPKDIQFIKDNLCNNERDKRMVDEGFVILGGWWMLDCYDQVPDVFLGDGTTKTGQQIPSLLRRTRKRVYR